jgi:hypothetical protein
MQGHYLSPSVQKRKPPIKTAIPARIELKRLKAPTAAKQAEGNELETAEPSDLPFCGNSQPGRKVRNRHLGSACQGVICAHTNYQRIAC